MAIATKEFSFMSSSLLSLKQVAQLLGVSERTVYRLMEEEKLHPFKMGKSWKFEQADIDNYIRHLRETATKQPKDTLQTP